MKTEKERKGRKTQEEREREGREKAKGQSRLIRTENASLSWCLADLC